MLEYQAAYWKVNKLTIPLHNSNLVILYQAGVASWGTDEGKFIRIFTQRSRPQLAATFPEYKAVSFKLRTTLNSRGEWGNLDGGNVTNLKLIFPHSEYTQVLSAWHKVIPVLLLFVS